MMAVLLVATAVVVSADDANAATGTTVNTDKANAFDLTNSAIGNDVAIAPVDGGYEITGTLNYIGTATEIADLDNATDVQKKFAETWPTNSDYGYGLVYQLQVENGKYVSFVASDGSWKSRIVEDGTRDILKYVNATTDTNTYYITNEATTAAPADDAEGVEKIVVTWNVTLNNTVDVDTEEALSAANTNSSVTEINVTKDITLTSGLELSKPMNIASGVTVDAGKNAVTISEGKTINATNGTYTGKVTAGTISATVDLTGTYTISPGSIDVDGTISGSMTVEGEGTDDVVISGTINGNLAISGTGVVTFDNATVSSNVDVTLGKGITYKTTGKFYLYGALIVPEGTTNSTTITVGSGAEFKAFPNAIISPSIAVLATDDTSKIDLGDAMGTQYIRQDVTSNLVYSQTQTVIIEESIFIKKGASLTVLGELIVNEGVEVIVEDGGKLIVGTDEAPSSTAKVTVNGDITVEDGGIMDVKNATAVDIAGTVESDGTLNINSIVTVKNAGSIIIDNGENSVFTIETKGKLTIDAGGNVEIRGQATVEDITNKGTVTLNGAVIKGSVKISMAADDAVVDIKSFSFVSGSVTTNALTITDSELVFKDNKDSSKVISVDGTKYTPNTLTFNAVENKVEGVDDNAIGIKGLVITEDVTSKTEKKETTYYNSFVLSGTANISDETVNGYEGKVTVNISGPSIDVAETLTIAKNVTLSLASGNLDVAGTITATAENATVVAAAFADINVTGMIETCVEIKENINAFSYERTVEGSTVWYYTTLKTAIDNGQTDIEALGTTSVLESVDIPAETTVKAGPGHELITIGSTDARDVVVTVKDGGEIRSCVIDVMGTLTFDNKRNDRGNTIYSDVFVEDDVSKSYTNIYTALNNAQSGDTVTIYRSEKNVVLDKDVVIKEGVTLDIPAGKGVTVNDTVTVTTDGTIRLSGALVAENVGFNPETDNHSTIVVNGAFMSVGEISYVDENADTVDYYIPGAYYNLVNTSGNWNYVTPVEDAAAVSNDVSEGLITIYGTNQVGDVSFTGDEDQPVYITLEGKLTASSLKLTYASFKVVDDANDYQFDGTLSSDVGSVQFVNANGFTVTSTVDDEGATVMSVTGAPAQVDMKGADAKMTVATGSVIVDDDADLVNDLNVSDIDLTIAEGATLTVTGSGVKMVADKLAVNGTLVAYDGGNVTANSVYVIGTFTVSPADSDNNILAGTADIDYIRVGLSKNFKTTSAATLNAEKITDWKYIYVSAESTVTAGLVENAASTQFYVEDALWFTVYGNGNSVKADAPGIVPTENVLLDKWTGKDVNNVTVTIENDAVDKSFTIGQVERFDADIDYDIYTVTVFADPGISAVYIDGKLMTSGVFRNDVNGMWAEGFQLSVAAGTHEITYKLGNYFSGEATMTVNGETVTGNTFTTSGTGTEDMKVTVYLQGIEASAPETPSTSTGGDDGMGLTDYLLIVLVVLIVIMAIMVALRMMRS